MRVIAAPGLRVPYEGKSRTSIEEAPAAPVDVPDTTYYRRRLATGELLRANEETSAPVAELSAEVEPAASSSGAKRRAKAAS